MAELAQYQQDFITRFAPYANLASQQIGLPSRVILAKLAVETGWGQHFANNNLPGLKTGNAGQNDGFPSAQTKTWEDYGGSGRTNIKDGFIKYPTPEQSIGGLVPWLSNSRYMNSLADRQGGGILDRDVAAEASAVSALGSSGFSTDRAASEKVKTVLDQMPGLSQYGIAPSFTPSIVQLMNYVPYNGASGMANVSEGLGPLTNNDYNSGTQFQNTGQLLPREKGSGLQLPSPQIPVRPEGSGLLAGLDAFSDAVTGGVESAGNAALGGLRSVGNLLSGGGSLQPAPGAYDFARQNVSGGTAPSSLGSGITPTPVAPGQYAFGGNVSGGVGNGSMAGFDAASYLAANPDVARSGIPAEVHYRTFGINEGRPLSPGAAAPSVSAPPAAPTLPNLGMGQTIGASPAIGSLPGFDAASYLAANPDVAQSGIPALTHYQTFGINEGRPLRPGDTSTRPPPGLSPSPTPQQAGTIGAGNTMQGLNPMQASTIGAPPAVSSLGGFDAASYLQANPDVAASGIPAETHYRTFGIREGRPLRPSDAQSIGAPGLTSTIAPPATTQATSPFGRPNQSMPSISAPTLPPSQSVAGFDAAAYLAANPDVARSGIPAAEHYRIFGINEGRPLAPGQVGTQPAPGVAQNVPPPGLSPLIGAPPAVSGAGAPGLTPTIAAPSLTPTIGAPAAIGSIPAPPAVTATDPGTVSNFGFSGVNVGAGLGAGPQTLGSFYGGNLLGGGGGAQRGISPFGFSQSNVGMLNLGAPSAPAPTGGEPFGGSAIVGGLGGNVRSDGTSAGTKSLAQTNAEFSATIPNYFARENAQDSIRNTNMASFGNPSIQPSPISTPMGYNTGHVVAPSAPLPGSVMQPFRLANGAAVTPLAAPPLMRPLTVNRF